MITRSLRVISISEILQINQKKFDFQAKFLLQMGYRFSPEEAFTSFLRHIQHWEDLTAKQIFTKVEQNIMKACTSKSEKGAFGAF